MLFRIIEFVKKEFIEIRRDRKTLISILIFPTVLLFVFTYAAKTDIEDLPVAVFDQDQTPSSRKLIDSFFETKYFERCKDESKLDELIEKYKQFPIFGEIDDLKGGAKRGFSNLEAVSEALDSGRCFMALVIPSGFGEKLNGIKPESAKVQLIIDGSIPVTAQQASSYGRLIASNFFAETAYGEGGGNRIVELSPTQINLRVLYNPLLDAILFMIPGLIGYILTFLTIMMASMAVIREREAGTFDQLLVTPLSGFEIIVGKLVPFGIISFIAVMMILVVSVFWFGLAIKGSIFVFIAGLIIFIMASLNLGFFISSVSKNQIQAGQMTIFYMLPSLILSGMYFPIFSMPKFFQYVSYIVPLKYFLAIMRGVTLKGAGFDVLWKDFAGIGAFLFISASLVTLRLSKGRS